MIIPILFVLLVLALAFSYFLAWLLRDPVLGWVYERVRPKNNEVKTLSGERIEAVFKVDFWSTTFIKIFEWSWKLLLLNMVLFLIPRVFFGEGEVVSQASNSILTFVYLIQALVIIVIFPIAILVYDWNKRYSIRVVVKTTEILILSLRVSLSGLLTGDAPLLLKSTSQIVDARRDLKISADPQDTDPSFRTTWLTDQVIALRASLGAGWHFWGGGVRSILLLTFVQRGSDKITLIYRGTTLEKIIETSSPRAKALTTRHQRLQILEVDAALGRLGEDFDEAEAQQAFGELKARNDESLWSSIEFDPFTVRDPGYWDMETGTERVSYDLHGQPASVTTYVR